MSESESKEIVEREVLVDTELGTVSTTRYTLDTSDEQRSTLLMVIPYRKDDFITYGSYDPSIRYLVHHGYDVFTADLLGTGASSGGFYANNLRVDHEATQIVDVIEWLASRDWSTGKVGMFGKSYGGWTCLVAASKNPEPLKAIVPVMTPNKAFQGRYPFGTLSLRNSGVWSGPLQAALPPSRRDSDGRWMKVWQNRLNDLESKRPSLFTRLEHDRNDDYWESKEISLEQIQVPSFCVGGWRDYYPMPQLENWARIKGPKRLLMGPWRHTMPHRGRETAVDFRSQMAEWFDHYLEGKDNGATSHAPIEYWTERNGGGKIDEGVWRQRETWPSYESSSQVIEFALTPNGATRLESFSEGEFEAEYTYDQTVGVSAMDWVTPPIDTRTDDSRSLCFDTDPLSDPVEFTGNGVASLRIKPTTSELLLFVRLVDVAPGGESSLVCYAPLRLPDRREIDVRDSLEPGKEIQVSAPFEPKSHIFEDGHKIRVAISASYFPRLMPPREQGSFTLISDASNPSYIKLPGTVHHEEVNFDDQISMSPPDETNVPVVSTFITDSNSSWDSTRDRKSDALSVNISDNTTLDLPHGPKLHRRGDVRWSVEPENPHTAKAVARRSAILEYETEIIEVQTRTRVTQDGAQISLKASADGQDIFEKTWRS